MCFLYHNKITFAIVKPRFRNVRKKKNHKLFSSMKRITYNVATTLLNSATIRWKEDNICFFQDKGLVNPTDHCIVFLLSSREDGRMTLVGRPTSWRRMHYEDIAKFSWGDVMEWISL